MKRFVRVFAPLALGLAVAFAAGTASAHAIVTWTSLKESPPAENVASTATVRFNAGIESKFARVSLYDAKGNQTELDQNLEVGKSEIRVPLPPLPAGTYALRVKVLAADGHYTEENLRFKILPAK